ncbi:hypothetical protein WNY37_15505 [Henriciella sp. AS95]|uniref:hypothetical protein n=1 Tax=Henriciella sp. AS95 TaxID=3135782 RepID=UPI00317124B1
MSEFELIVADDRTLPLVQHLRYRVYCAEKQFAMAGADHEARILVDSADRLGVTFALFEGAELVSSAQVIPVNPLATDARFAVFDLASTLPRPDQGAVIVSKLVTSKDRRGSKTLGPVMRAVLEFVAAEKRRYIAILAETSMRDFYASMGFEALKEGIEAAPFGTVTLMVFDMKDERHLSGKSLAGWMFKPVFAR